MRHGVCVRQELKPWTGTNQYMGGREREITHKEVEGGALPSVICGIPALTKPRGRLERRGDEKQ